MSIKRVDVIENFTATDKDGRIFNLRTTQQIIDASSFGNPHGEVPGIKSMSLSDGSPVNYIDENTFQVVQTGTILTRT
jgi:hypothetical protein